MLVASEFSLLKKKNLLVYVYPSSPHPSSRLSYEEISKDSRIVSGAGAWRFGMSSILETAILFHV